MKQNRRWLHAKIQTEFRGFINPKAIRELFTHLKKSEQHYKRAKITDGVALSDAAKSALKMLENERAAAVAEQGREMEDAEPGKGKERSGRRRRREASGEEEVSVEGLEDEVGVLGLTEVEKEKEGLSACALPLRPKPAEECHRGITQPTQFL